MVDFRVDDGFPNHPKTVGLPHEAIGVWLLAGCWCARYLTDGYIPTEAMQQITRRRQPINDLVNRNLLQQIEGGYLFVDWLDYQRSRDQVAKERDAGRERLAKWRAKRQQPDP